MKYFDLIKKLFTLGEQLKQKAWFLSRTVWVNVLAMVAQVVALATHGQLIIDNPEIAVIANGVLAIVNIFYRFKTSSPIGVVTVEPDNESVVEGSDYV